MMKVNGWVREGQWLGLGRSMVGSGKVNGWVREGQWLGPGRSMVGSGKVNGWVWEGQWLGLGKSMVGSGKVNGPNSFDLPSTPCSRTCTRRVDATPHPVHPSDPHSAYR